MGWECPQCGTEYETQEEVEECEDLCTGMEEE